MSELEFPKLQNLTEIIDISEAGTDIVIEVQSLLKLAELYKGEIDGIAGDGTLKAFADFKESVWLAEPSKLGKSTASALIEIANEHKGSLESNPTNNPQQPSNDAGSKSGRSLILPNGDRIFQNQFVIPGIPLTWGEVTNGCHEARTPISNSITTNILKLARGFGQIREAYGKPLGVTSGYRPPAVNRAIGGARYSQHINGLALDIYPHDGNFTKLLSVIKASDCVGIGLGMQKGFIHIDWRNGDRVVFNYL